MLLKQANILNALQPSIWERGISSSYFDPNKAGSGKHQSRPKRVIDCGDHSVELQTESVKATEFFYRCSSTPVPSNIFNLIRWAKASNSCTPLGSAWLNYVYGDEVNFEQQSLICEAIWLWFNRKLQERIKEETRNKLKNLVWLAVQSTKVNIRAGECVFKGCDLAKALEVNKKVYSKTFKKHYEVMMSLCDLVDRAALNNAMNEYDKQTRTARKNGKAA